MWMLIIYGEEPEELAVDFETAFAKIRDRYDYDFYYINMRNIGISIEDTDFTIIEINNNIIGEIEFVPREKGVKNASWN